MDNNKRHRLNNINLSTFLGLTIAHFLGGKVFQLDNQMYINYGRKGKYQKAGAITIGDVILAKGRLSDSVIKHETIHGEQFAKFGGLVFLALYSFASIKSFILYRNRWQGNIYEIQAGLQDGEYL
jgi:hypothetical protein